MHFLKKYLPKAGLIFDARGRPSRYMVGLARRGYEVVLLDLSPRCFEIAVREVEEAGSADRVSEVIGGSVADLSRFGNVVFDGVLCLGDLYIILLKGPKESRR
jgi:hypothetical protein